MNLAPLIKPASKHLGVVAFFFLLVYISFTPLFKGLSLPQHDIKMWYGGAKETIDYREKTGGEDALWTNSMFGGMPSYLISTRYPGNLTKTIQGILTLNLSGIPKIMFASLISFYLCLLCFRIKWPIAIFGSIAFTFTAFNLVSLGAGHNAKILALALLPLMIGGMKLVLNKKYVLGGALFAIGVALEIGAGHPQITYYGGIILLFMFISEILHQILQSKLNTNKELTEKSIKPSFIKHDLIKILGVLALTGIIGLLPHTSRLLTLKEYSKYSTRGKSELSIDKKNAKDGLTRDYVFQYSQGLKECNNIFLPNMFIDSKGNKWSEGNSYPMYYGSFLFILFLLMFTILKPKDWIWIIITCSLGIIFSLGKHFPTINFFFYDYLPLYSKFRAVNMALSMFQFSFVLGGTLVLNKVLSKDFKLTKHIKINLIAIAVFLVVGITINLGITTSLSDIAVNKRLEAFRQSGIWTAVYKSILYTILFAAIGFTSLYIKKNKAIIIGVIASIILLIDLSNANKPHFSHERFVKTSKTRIRPTKANKEITNKKGHDRVIDFSKSTFNDATASYFHHSIGGYHGAKLRRFQDVVDMYFNNENINQIFKGLQTNRLEENNVFNGLYKTLKSLNTKYIIHNPSVSPITLNSLGNGWFVKEITVVNSPDEELAYLGNKNFNPNSSAVIDQSKFKPNKTSYNNEGSVKLSKYAPNKLTYYVKTDSEGLAVFSEIFYPEGWVATINGEEAPIKRVNYILRALEIPKGEHEVIFEFKPSSYYTGEKIALIGSILIILLLLSAIGWEIKSNLKVKEQFVA